MPTFCNSYVLWLLRCVQLRLVTVTFCDVNVVWCYVLSQYLPIVYTSKLSLLSYMSFPACSKPSCLASASVSIVWELGCMSFLYQNCNRLPLSASLLCQHAMVCRHASWPLACPYILDCHFSTNMPSTCKNVERFANMLLVHRHVYCLRICLSAASMPIVNKES
jgi:hypothetical protein